MAGGEHTETAQLTAQHQTHCIYSPVAAPPPHCTARSPSTRFAATFFPVLPCPCAQALNVLLKAAWEAEPEEDKARFEAKAKVGCDVSVPN